jgi:hypothetical protein
VKILPGTQPQKRRRWKNLSRDGARFEEPGECVRCQVLVDIRRLAREEIEKAQMQILEGLQKRLLLAASIEACGQSH